MDNKFRERAPDPLLKRESRKQMKGGLEAVSESLKFIKLFVRIYT